jgi:hypothetical protein
MVNIPVRLNYESVALEHQALIDIAAASLLLCHIENDAAQHAKSIGRRRG